MADKVPTYVDKNGGRFHWDEALRTFIPTGPRTYKDESGNKFVWDAAAKRMMPDIGSNEDAYKQLVESMSFPEQAAVAAGREMTKLGRGVKGWFANPEQQKKLDARKESEDLAYEAGMGKYGNTGAEIVGTLAPYVGPGLGAKAEMFAAERMIPGITKLSPNVIPGFLRPLATPPAERTARMVNKAKEIITGSTAKNVGYGASVGAAHEDSNALTGAGIGALGTVVGHYMGAPLSKVKNILDDEGQRIIKWAMKKGFSLPPGMKTGQVPLREVDRSLRTRVGTSGLMDEYVRQNQKLANQIAAEKIGVKGVDSLSPEIFSTARQEIGATMNNLAKHTQGYMTVNDQVAIYNKIFKYGRNLFNKESAATMKAQMDDIFKRAMRDVPGLSGSMRFDGASYKSVNNILKQIMDTNYKQGGDKGLAEVARFAKDKFDDAVEKGMILDTGKSGASKAWRDARAKYRYLNEIEGAMTFKGGSGNIDLSELYRNYMRNDRQRMLEGKMYDEEMANLAKLGNIMATQKAASLGASQMIGNMLSGKNVSANTIGLLERKNFRAPFLDEMAVRAYHSGYPVTTGLLGLPAGTPEALGKALSRAGLLQMSD